MTTTDTMERPSASERYSPQCPDWCTMNPREHEEATAVVWTDDNARVPVIDHTGPSFGPFFTTATEYLVGGQPLYVTVEGEVSPNVMSPVDLRKLAADALAAAEWLEAQA